MIITPWRGRGMQMRSTKAASQASAPIFGDLHPASVLVQAKEYQVHQAVCKGGGGVDASLPIFSKRGAVRTGELGCTI